MLDYALDWTRHFFGDGGQSGIFGCAQCAVVVHDDNENGVVHAHVIVNNTNLENGKRIHINLAESKDLANYAQDLARARHWRYFDNTPTQEWIAAEAHLPLSERRAMLPDGTSKSLIERNMERRGEDVWKNDMRTRIGVAKNISQTEADFVEACSELGIKVHFKEADGDYLFAATDTNNQENKCMGRGLGKDYFGRGVEGRRTLVMQMPSKEAAKLRTNVLRAMSAAQSYSVRVAGTSGVSQRQIAVALATMRKWNVTNATSLSKALSRCGGRVGKASSNEKNRHQKEYARLKNVEKLSGKIGLFEGIGKDANRAGRIRELKTLQATSEHDPSITEELNRVRLEEFSARAPRSVPALGAGGFFGAATDGDDENAAHGIDYGAPTPIHHK